MTSTSSTQATPESVKVAGTPDAFTHKLATVAGEVERFMVDLLGGEVRPGEIARPARLMEAMRHAVLGGGKRLRPFLTVETARMLGGPEAGAMAAGAGV